MSRSAKKGAAQPASPSEGKPGEEVVHVPKGTSRLRFLLTLVLTIFVLLVFTVGDQLVGTVRRGGGGTVYMTWEHPQDGLQEIGYQDFIGVKRSLDDFYRVAGLRMPRGEDSDENVANLIVTDRIAKDAGIEIPNAELVRAIMEGEPGLNLRAFLNSANYKSQLQALGVTAPEFEAALRTRMRVLRFQLFLALSLGQPEPSALEKLWREDHQQHAFDLVGLAPADLRQAAEAEVPDATGLETWYGALEEGEKRKLFGDDYLPELTALALLSWPADGEPPAALLERFPRPAGTDLAVLARGYYDSSLTRRYRKPQEPADPEESGAGEATGESGETGEATPPQENPADPAAADVAPAGDQAGSDETEPAQAEESVQEKLYLPFEEVAERARIEAQVLAALTDLQNDLRTRLRAEEAVDLAALASELGLAYESDGLPRSREEWAQTADSWLADGVAFTAPDGLAFRPIVGTARLWLPRVLERKPPEAPPFAVIQEKAREAWLDERCAALSREKLQALHDALAPAPPPEAEGAAAPLEVPAVVVDAEAFAAKVLEAGLELAHQDWFDPARPSPVPDDEQSPVERFLRSTWFPGADLYTLEEGAVSEPREGLDGERVWLIRCAGKRDPAEVDIRPNEYEMLRRRALAEGVGAVFEKMTSPEELAARYKLAFPGHRKPGGDEEQGGS